MAYSAFGLACVGVGFVGVVTPGLPGFVFFLIALGAFRKSSPRLEEWLLSLRYVGPALRDWDDNRAMKLRTKIIAITMLWGAIAFSCWYAWFKSPLVIKQLNTTLPLWVPIGLLLLTAGSVTCYLARVKTA